MPRLLIHADDFGLTLGVTRGILRAMHEGVVTATSAMVCDPEARERVARFAGEVPGAVGLHLQLTDGVPVLPPREVSSLVDSNGRFPLRREQIGNPRENEVLAEWRAQLAAFRGLDLTPSHLDTHHSVHALPAIARAYVRIGIEASVPVRGADPAFNIALRAEGLICADRYECVWKGGPVKTTALLRTIAVFRRLGHEEMSVEIGCHPAFPDEELAAKSRYVEERGVELEVLCERETRRRIRELGFELVTPDRLASSCAVVKPSVRRYSEELT